MDCSTNRYAELYAPWLSGSADFAWRFIKPSDRVLDLCGGTGLVAQAALDMGCPEVTLLDVNPRVVPAIPRLGVLTGDANHLCNELSESNCLDVVVCRQAIAYLDLRKVSWSAAQALSRGGRFCFNNFKEPRWFSKRYRFAGDRYREVGWYVGRQVFHIQQKIGVGWDLSRFHWHTHDEVMKAMSRHFNVSVQRSRRAYHYTCTVK